MISIVGSGFTGFINEIKGIGQSLFKTVSSVASKFFGSKNSSEFAEKEAVALSKRDVVVPMTPEDIESIMSEKVQESVILDRHTEAMSKKALKILGKGVETMVLPSTEKNHEDLDTLEQLASFRREPQEGERAFQKRKAALTKRGREISKDTKRMLGIYRRKLLLQEPKLTKHQILSRFVENMSWSGVR